jgi:hypothetical protein
MIVAVKYSLKNLVGWPFNPAMGVRYDFRTGHRRDRSSTSTGTDSSSGSRWSRGWATVRTATAACRSSTGRSPNPFTNNTRIAYAVATPNEIVDIRVYDLAGRLVRVLAKGTQAPGIHYAIWDGRGRAGDVDPQGHVLRPRAGRRPS